MKKLNSILKRVFDIILSLTGLIIAFPVMLIIALAIRLESPGSVLFSQTRLGLNGRKFQIHKFRKFPVSLGIFGSNVTVAGDARMTSVGSFIEKTKLDELPQLWNILKGEMSCVGPRPESLAYADLFTDEYKKLLNFKPGIFGPNQIEFRNESELYSPDQDPDEFYRNVLFHKKAKVDIEYFSNANCITELLCIVQGLWVCLLGSVNWRKLVTTHGKFVLADLIAIEFSWLAVNFMRFGLAIDGHDLEGLWAGLVLFPIITLSIMLFAGVYRTPSLYFSGSDASRMVIAVSLGWIFASFIVIGFIQRNISISLPPISLLIVLFLMSIRRIWGREKSIRSIQSLHTRNKNKIMIYGVGYRGSNMAKLVEQGFPGTEIVGLIDDRPEMRRCRIGKYKVIGCYRDLDTLHRIHKFDQLWMSFSPAEENFYQIDNWCQKNNIKLVVLPNIEAFSGLSRNYKSSDPNPGCYSDIARSERQQGRLLTNRKRYNGLDRRWRHNDRRSQLNGYTKYEPDNRIDMVP